MSDHKLQDSSAFPAVDSAASEIRILGLCPGEADGPIHCKYHVVRLDDLKLSYETLSYAWHDDGNDGTSSSTIYIDKKSVEVSRTLYRAVKRLRQIHNMRYLWIDAICINQADDREKTQQVNMMRRIYSQCDQCVIWLGSLGSTSSVDAQAALDTITWIAGEQTETPQWIRDASRRNGAASALKTLITAPWWNRIWTVQEAILPPQAILYWGPLQLPWNLLHQAAQKMVEGGAPGGIPGEFDKNSSLGDVCAALSGLRFSPHESLLHLLWRWRYRRATDPRDKVYALMGIRDDLAQTTMRSCDYEVDVVALYSRVTADLINLNGDLEVLIGRRGEKSLYEGLPSWAVDWTGLVDGRGVSEFWEHSSRYYDLDFTADRGLYGVGDGLRMADQRTLILSGIYIDRIAVVEQLNHANVGRAASSPFLTSGGERWGRLFTDYQTWLATHKSDRNIDSGWMRSFLGLVTGKLVTEDPGHGESQDIWVGKMLTPQAVFITEEGRFGVGPRNAQPGQEVWCVGGCRFPVVLQSWHGVSRRMPKEERALDFTFVADCFVYGIMRGEARDGREPVDIRLH